MEFNIKNQQVNAFLRGQPLIKNIDDTELSYLVDVAEIRVFGPREVVFPQGENSNDLYFIYDGEVDILNTDPNSGKEFSVGRLKKGDTFGDLAFLDDEPRSSTVQAITETVTLKISKETTYSQSSEMTNIYNKIMKNIAKVTIKRLRDSNVTYTEKMSHEINSLQQLIDAGKLFVLVVMLNWSLQVVFSRFGISVQNWVQTALCAGILLLIVPKFGPIERYGLSLTNLKTGFKEALWIVLSLIVGSIAIYFLLKAIHSIYPNLRVFDVGTPQWHGAFIFYPFYVYLREFVYRGVLQTSLKDFLHGSGKRAVLYASAIIAAFNLSFGLTWALASFGINYSLGYFYLQKPQLISVSFIHMVIGILLVLFNLIPASWLFLV